MPSLSRLGWSVYCLLLLWRSSAQTRCSTSAPVGELHPVQGLLERFEAGPGCAARELGNKETHVIAVGRVTNSPENKVTVVLKPLSASPSSLRALHLLLSSRLPLSWWLEAERLPSNLPVLVQLSSNSSIQSRSLQRLNVQTMHSIPFHPYALHRWALKHHGHLSSLTHVTHGNRVYIALGEDPTQPAVCQLQPMFLSHNYMASDLQRQEVQGCAEAPAAGTGREVHVIKLHSAGSGLCGSLQVEVIVFLVPLVANLKSQTVVLILSSSTPVNWAINARGVRGHIFIHSSNSVSSPYPPEPDLYLSSTVNPDLSTISDLLAWAGESGYTKVTSYTEADLANRFVIQLAGGGTDVVAALNPLIVKPPWAEERRLRPWLNGAGRAGGDQESFTVQCEDGQLSVTLDRQMLQEDYGSYVVSSQFSLLQSLSGPVAAVTLRDSTCQAQSNGSHFLLVFPVISCGTEGVLLGQLREIQYKNMVLLWRDEPQTILALNETARKSTSPLGIHFSCLATGSAPTSDVTNDTPEAKPGPLTPEGPGTELGLGFLPTPKHRPGPALSLKLFVTENYERRQNWPCVITVNHRIYVEISGKGPFADFLEVNSCVVSPMSDPKKPSIWTVISNGCLSDPSLTLDAKDEEVEEAMGDEELELEKEQMERVEEGRSSDQDQDERKAGKEAPARMEKSDARMREEGEIQLLRFSFILRPVYNDSMQFLHCSLRLCVSDPASGKPKNNAAKDDCQGRRHIPPLVARSPTHQCEIRNLSRPMVVTQPLSSLLPKLLRPPTGQRTKRLSVSPVPSAHAELEHSSSVAVLQVGPVMGVVFVAFVMGVILTGGLWCIYYCTGARPASLVEDNHLTDHTQGVHNVWNPPSLSDLSSSCV